MPLRFTLALVLTVACAVPEEPTQTPVQAATPPSDRPLESRNFLADRLAERPDLFGDLLERADHHRIKLELAIVVEGPGGPTLERYSMDAGPEYFYPASTVKTCAAVAALQELQRQRARGHDVDVDTPLRFHPLFEGETIEERDPSHVANGAITVAHDLAKVFLVSDNAAYNRLYELAGNAGVNRSMRAAGLRSTRILHRLSEFRSPEDQLRTPRVELLGRDGVLATVPERAGASPGTNAGMTGIVFGSAHTHGEGLIDGPMSFERKNYASLRDLQDLHVLLLQPGVPIPGRNPLGLDPGDAQRVADLMASTPGASLDPVYDAAEYPDEYSKFLLPGVLRVRRSDEVTVRDKVGRAYGFSVTNSEVIDRRTGRSYFLAATIYTNPNDVVGDGVYDYPRADRFMADLGEVISAYVFDERP